MPGVEPAAVPFVTIRSSHPAMRDRRTELGLAVHNYPFTIGRPPEAKEETPADLADLVVDDEQPFWVARVQATLVRDADGIWVVDGSSIYGTLINGNPIGPGAEMDRAKLQAGRNHIRLGGEHSPYTLEIDVEFYDNKIAAA